jgi:hypothetical protein
VVEAGRRARLPLATRRKGTKVYRAEGCETGTWMSHNAPTCESLLGADSADRDFILLYVVLLGYFSSTRLGTRRVLPNYLVLLCSSLIADSRRCQAETCGIGGGC